jgi:hypothetical protein
MQQRKNVSLVFILGTGRSGTDSYAKTISGIEGCYIAHELNPVLLSEAAAWLTGQYPQENLVELLRTTRAGLLDNGYCVSGESNQRLSFILPALAAAFPEAKYLCVLRDARMAIPSMLHRYWYYANERQLRPTMREWVDNRIRADMVEEMSFSEWSALPAFGRCAWYWNFTYRRIFRDFHRLGLNNLIVRIEDGSKSLPKVCEFMGLSVRQNELILHRSNTSQGGSPADWRSWTDNERQLFERFCGSLMDQYYPAWRDEWKLQPLVRGAAMYRRLVNSGWRFIRKRTLKSRNLLGLTRA